jgi:hypothetical protein
MGRIELLSAPPILRRFGDQIERLATFRRPSVFPLAASSHGGQPESPASLMLRTINYVNLAHRAAVALRANVPAVSRGIIHNHRPSPADSGSLRARTQGRTFDTDRHGALSDFLQRV